MQGVFRLIFVLFLFGFKSFCQTEVPYICAQKAEERIIIDGVLNELIWNQCDRAGNFCQNFPADTSNAISQTQVSICYDEKYLYVAARCYESKKGRYIIQSLKRDFSYPVSDAFVVTIDPFLDGQNGFSFGVNPYGVQREGLVSNGGGMGVTTNWDNKWFSAVTNTDSVWYVEMAIPFKTLRYKPELNEWGINFARNDLKQNESSTWVKVPRAYNISTLSFTGRVKFDEKPKKPGANFAIIPYGIGRYSKDFIAKSPEKYELNGGADAKIALTPSLNLDLTVNPDFSQVDVDRQVTNLTRFSLFFPEQRQFFIENSDLFERFGFRQIRPFFSRRIGLENGNIIPIIAGARLSGKPNKDWRIGLMDIQTAQTKISDVTYYSQNYFVGAVQRNVFKRSNISAIVVNRQQFDSSGYSPNNYNRVVGLDYNLASADNRWFGKFFFHHSFSNNNNNDAYAHASFLNYTTNKVSLEWNHEYVNKNYNVQTGFTPRIFQTDYSTGKINRVTYWRIEPRLRYFLYPRGGVINRMGPELYLDQYMNDKLFTTDVHLQSGWFIFFQNTGELSVYHDYYFTKLLFPTDITFSGNIPLPKGNYDYHGGQIRFKTNQRRMLNASATGSYGAYFTGNKLSGTLDVSYRWQPYGIFTLSYSHDEIFLANLKQPVRLDLIGPRVEISFSKSVFFTTFLQYNSQINNFNVYSRLQWRFRPMSDVFIVYSDNYNAVDFSKKNRALVVKMVFWLSPS